MGADHPGGLGRPFIGGKKSCRGLDTAFGSAYKISRRAMTPKWQHFWLEIAQGLSVVGSVAGIAGTVSPYVGIGSAVLGAASTYIKAGVTAQLLPVKTPPSP